MNRYCIALPGRERQPSPAGDLRAIVEGDSVPLLMRDAREPMLFADSGDAVRAAEGCAEGERYEVRLFLGKSRHLYECAAYGRFKIGADAVDCSVACEQLRLL